MDQALDLSDLGHLQPSGSGCSQSSSVADKTQRKGTKRLRGKLGFQPHCFVGYRPQMQNINENLSFMAIYLFNIFNCRWGICGPGTFLRHVLIKILQKRKKRRYYHKYLENRVFSLYHYVKGTMAVFLWVFCGKQIHSGSRSLVT